MFNRQRFKLFAFATLTVLTWLTVVLITALYGWWMSPISEPGDAEDFLRNVVQLLEEENPGGNSALLLIEQGRVFDTYYSSSGDTINADTVFSTASMSKWISAVGIMSLVEQGKLNLDDPVERYLTRWSFPPGSADSSAVTVRHLLSHTAGLSDGLGFGDYDAEETLPGVEESLASPRSSDGRQVSLTVDVEPGTLWQYSGGGYLVLELLVEEVTGLSFEEYMSREIFTPLEMSRSGYAYVGSIENNAGSYDTNGEATTVYQYASKAATAFATSTADLARFVLAQIPSSTNDRVLSDDSLQSMRAPHGRTLGADVWGLGAMLYAPTPEGDFVFGHDGGNEPAINTIARINPDTGDAIIVLLTGHPSLATQLGSHWVLWQTGYPDVLDLQSVIASMVLPAALGSCLILLLFLLFATGLHRTLFRSSSAD